jgi:hypothetical protein
MNQYPIWIGLTVALVMVCLAPNPVWWMILVLGVGANGIVLAANGWKMPVRGSTEETIRHVPMTKSTRRKWLGDIIPTGLGKASVGDFLIAAGVMGGWATRSSFADRNLMLILCLVWWGSGWARGFALFEKWPKEVRRDARKNLPIVLVLMALGNLVNVRGCSIGALRASAECLGGAMIRPNLKEAKVAHNGKPQGRDLGKVSLRAPTEFLKRLKVAEAKRELEATAAQKVRTAFHAQVQKQMAEIQRDPVSHVQKLRVRDLQKTEQSSFVISQNSNGFIYKTYNGAVMRWTLHGGYEELAPPVQQPQQWTAGISGSGSGAVMMSGTGAGIVVMGGSVGLVQRIGTRKGPFCRVTCEFHHSDGRGAGSGDVEVDADYCDKKVIPEDAMEVPGWYPIDAEHERENPWPGPAQGGLDHYKLYWK